MSTASKRSSMIFYSDPGCHYSHCVRVVLAEKGMAIDIVGVDDDEKRQELVDINPYNSLPTLLDRDLVLYEYKIIMEYIDERFPHPPLLPVYPVARASSRQLIYRIERDCFSLVDTILAGKNQKATAKARKTLRENLMVIAPIFAEKPFFMSDEFSLVDCCLAPLLWRLPVLDITLPDNRQTKPLLHYIERLFERKSFQASLSEEELEMRKV